MVLLYGRMENGKKNCRDKKNARHGPEDNFLRAVERIDNATERQGHSEARASSTEDDDSNSIHLPQLLLETDLVGVNARNTPDQTGISGSRDEEVDVESPSPGRATLGKGSTDDRTNDGTNAPDNEDTCQIQGAFPAWW